MTLLPNALPPSQSPFQQAIATVEQWLDGPGQAFVRRSEKRNSRRKAASWDLLLAHPTFGEQRVELSILPDFPASPPEIHFSPKLCLVIPHIEETGKFCHGCNPSANDYEAPCAVVEEVLRRLDRYWVNITNPTWVAAEFQRECLSYWSRFCERACTKAGLPAPRSARVALGFLNSVTEGQVTSYHERTPGRARSRHLDEARTTLLIATVGELDPHVIAAQHGWSSGTMMRGDALWVPMSPDQPWTPNDWPTNLVELDQLVSTASNGQHSAVEWLTRKLGKDLKQKRANQYQPRLVFFVQGNTCYGYLITPTLVPLLTGPGVVPIEVVRIDADWALARDNSLATVLPRREKRVLVLGCGSLGAPVAELLARAGIGTLHLLDKETFAAENCARHLLGIDQLGEFKATALADRLKRLIPAINVRAFTAMAADWISERSAPGSYDLVVDCTGESSVRMMLARFRDRSFGNASVVHAWLEPFGAAAHVIYSSSQLPWPSHDPWRKINVAHWPQETRVQIPACASGFHPYGAADAWQAAGFAAERILACLDEKANEATVWSWIRSSAFFDNLIVQPERTRHIPEDGGILDSRHVTRLLSKVLTDD